MGEGVIECAINFLSYDRAASLVPPEFLVAYDWFQSMEGEVIPRLPRGNDAPKLAADIKLAAMRGIHSPNYRELPSNGAGKTKYALSVYSAAGKKGINQLNSFYEDQELIFRPDGTWILEYCAQRPVPGRLLTDKSNSHLMNNLADGVPVAVMLGRPSGGYDVMGLAYVERFDPLTNMFTLHGPVSAEAGGVCFDSDVAFEDLSAAERDILRSADEGADERAKTLAEVVRRERQGAFRYALVEAYEGSCAITGFRTPEVLQAAHIDPYRGAKSQIVANGMLLRSDLHLLYDSHLLTVLPDSFEVRVSNAVTDAGYKELDGQRIRLPKAKAHRPSEALLELHAREYELVQRKLA